MDGCGVVWWVDVGITTSYNRQWMMVYGLRLIHGAKKVLSSGAFGWKLTRPEAKREKEAVEGVRGETTRGRGETKRGETKRGERRWKRNSTYKI